MDNLARRITENIAGIAGVVCIADAIIDGFLQHSLRSDDGSINVTHSLHFLQLAIGTLLIFQQLFSKFHSFVSPDAVNTEYMFPNPTVLFSNVSGNAHDLFSILQGRGLVIVNMIQLNDPSAHTFDSDSNGSGDASHSRSDLFLIACEASSRLVDQMNCLYSLQSDEGLSTLKVLRLTEKAVMSVTDNIRYESYQMLPCGSLSIEKLNSSDHSTRRRELNEYFGRKKATFFEWESLQPYMFTPIICIWAFLSLFNFHDYFSLAAVFTSFAVSAGLSYLNLYLEDLSRVFTTLQLRGCAIESLQLATFATKLSHRSRVINVFGSGLVVIGFMCVQYAFAYVSVLCCEYLWSNANRFAGPAITVILLSCVEIGYYCLSMVYVCCLESSVCNRLTRFEMNPTRVQDRFSNSTKNFVLKVFVFAAKIVFHFVRPTAASNIQLTLILLLLCHHYFHELIAKASSGITKRLSYRMKLSKSHINSTSWAERSHMKSVDIRALEEECAKHNTFDVHLKSSAATPATPTSALAAASSGKKHIFYKRLSKTEEFMLDESLKTKLMVSKLYDEINIYLSVMLLSLAIAPLVIPLCFYCIRSVSRLQLRNLVSQHSRPLTADEDGSMQPWIKIIEVFSIVAVAFNILVVFIYSVDLSFAVPLSGTAASSVCNIASDASNFNSCNSSYAVVLTGPIARWITAINTAFGFSVSPLNYVVWFVCCEHLFVFVRCLCWPTIQNVLFATQLREEAAKQAIIDRDVVLEHRLFQYWFQSTHLSTLRSQKQIKLKNSAIVKLSELQGKVGVAISPIVFLGLVSLPYAVKFWNLPIYVLFLGLLLFCCYYFLQTIHKNKAIETNRVADAELKALLREEFPGFMFGTEMERCGWVNTLLDYTWPQLAQYGINMVKKQAEPALLKAKPPFATHLKFTTFSLGTVPPRILGIRALDAVPGKDMVEVDVDFIFNSDMEITLSLGLGFGKEINISIADFKMSGTGRMECHPLIPMIPPFAFGRGTFFKRPNIDFSLIINEDFDLMNIGIGLFGFRSIMKTAIKFALEQAVMYPKGIQQPLVNDPSRFKKTNDDDGDICFTDGILGISVLSCANLTIGDITSSDPYVKLQLNDQEDQTDVVYACLDPVWENASFSLVVTSKQIDILELEVWDKDVASQGTFLGRASIYVGALQDGVTTTTTLPLADVEHGTITLSLCYYPIQGRQQAETDAMTDQSLESNLVYPMMFYQENQQHMSLDDKSLAYSAPSVVDGSTKSFYDEDSTGSDGMNTPRKTSSYQPPPPLTNSPSQLSTDLLRHHLRQQPAAQQLNIQIAGLLIISNISYSKVKSVKTMLQKVHYFAPYVTFTLAQVRKRTENGPSKKSSHEFPDVFQMVVSNIEQDTLHVKLKYTSTMGIQTTLAEVSVRIVSVASAPNSTQVITHDIYKDRGTATGEFSFQATFRPAASLK